MAFRRKRWRTGATAAAFGAVLCLLFGCASSTESAGTRTFLELDQQERNKRFFAETNIAPRYLDLPQARLRFIALGPADAEQVFVLVHGIGGSLADFGPLAGVLREHARLFALDLPGFGESVSRSETYTIAGFTDALDAFVRAGRIERAHFVCHSMGGQVCIDFTLKHADRVASLTLIDAAGTYDPGEFMRRQVQGLGINAPLLDPSSDPIVHMLGGDNTIVSRLVDLDPFVLSALDSFQHNLRLSVRHLSVPVLLVWGALDELFPVDNGFFLHANVPGSTLRILEEAGHSPHMSHPRIVHRFIWEFVQ